MAGTEGTTKETKRSIFNRKTMKANETVVRDKPKANDKLINQYVSQSKPTMMNMNYKGPTGQEESWDTKAHTGGPGCYGCCGTGCAISFVGIIVILIVCCAYVSPKDQPCCSICYWPF